jgi:GntR family transcriptional regulator
MSEIDHHSAVPVFRQLAEILRGMITSGEVPPGKALPSIPYLSQEYGIADGTVKKAIQLLKDEDLVIGVPGKGTFVIDQS